VTQFEAADVGRLHIDVTSENRQVGVLGVYWRDRPGEGRIVLFNNRFFHVVLHEVAHHMTLSQRQEVAGRIRSAVIPSGVKNASLNDVPSRYARTNDVEFLAEWVSTVREREKNLDPDIAFALPTFSPNPTSVQVTQPIYARTPVAPVAASAPF